MKFNSEIYCVTTEMIPNDIYIRRISISKTEKNIVTYITQIKNSVIKCYKQSQFENQAFVSVTVLSSAINGGFVTTLIFLFYFIFC